MKTYVSKIFVPDSVDATFLKYNNRHVDSCNEIIVGFHGFRQRGTGRNRMPKTAEARIVEILESIRPALRADGGDLEFLGFDEAGGVVEVRLLGACESCPISMMTLKEGIERRLKSSVPGVNEVQAV